MALHLFVVFAEAKSPDRAFAAAKQDPLLKDRSRYELLDPTTTYPSDADAYRRAEWIYGVQPQESQVDIAGPDTNTVRAIRVYTTDPGSQRYMYFGVRRAR